MKVLFVCSLGMSSAVAVKALEKEAKSKGVEIEVKAVSTQQFEEEVKNGYDVAMITPQGYSPLGGPKLLNQIQELTQNK